MSDRYPGGVVSKTPPTVTAPVDGEGGSASGVWTLNTVAEYERASGWPKPVIPRELYAWGSNSDGRLGDGTTVNRSSPVQIGALTTWSKVSAGQSAGAAIKGDGTLWTWGSNGFGTLGNNTNISRSSPIQVGSLTNWSEISGGAAWFLALKTDGTMWSWGYGGAGRLGDNTVVTKSSPVQIGSLTNWHQISAGNEHALAVTTSGELYAWGDNFQGELGNNERNIDRSSPVQIGSLTNWAQVSAGGSHSHAVKTDGTLWAWGENSQGRLGDGTTASRSSPVQIGSLTDWAEVAAGGSHSHAVKTDGTLWAWGKNDDGALGINLNSYNPRSSPVQVGALTNWSSVSAGSSNSGALKTDNTLWMWGLGFFGTVGDNTNLNRSSPVQIGASDWLTLSLRSSTISVIALKQAP